MWKSSEENQPQPRPSAGPAPAPGAGQALIGASIAVQGKLAGKEDLQIDGRFEGEIRVPGHQVTIGRQGSVQAEVQARRIVVEGKLSGNIVAEEQAVVRASGRVDGDIKAPKVALEEGCQFKGQIDMEPGKKEESREGAGNKEEGREAAPKGSEEGKPATPLTGSRPPGAQGGGEGKPGETEDREAPGQPRKGGPGPDLRRA